VTSPDDDDDAADAENRDEEVADETGTQAFADLGPWWAPPPGVDMGLRAHLRPDGSPHIIERRFEVTEDFAGHRLDHYLKRMIPRLSRTRIQTVIRSQLHRGAQPGDDARPFRPSTTVAVGDTWVIRRPARAEPPCPRTFGVLYKDASVMVVDKPAGLPVHASAKFYFNTLMRVVSERFPDEAWQICHRLDRETSGVLVLANGATAGAALKACFAGKRADKTYVAIVRGDPPWPDVNVADAAGDVALDFPLHLAQPGDPSRLPHVRMLVRDGGLPSMTCVSVLERVPGYALVRCRLITGRQHQIRAHLAHAGFPIIGDKLYGAGEDAFIGFCDRGWTRELAETVELPRQALHAWRIRVPHPDRPPTEPLEITAPLAWDMALFLLDRRGAS
jgi:23S rRNA pseudouridine1911/1915/1917 synthase